MRAGFRRTVVGLAVSVVSVTVLSANVASADSVQHQSYQRASQSDACVAQPGETPWQASWGSDSSWKPSWEQWANDGKGGWTCTRAISWARDGAARVYNLGDVGPGGGLVFLIDNGVRYEMAPRTWRGSSSDDTPSLTWCDGFTDVSSAVGTAVGTGAANTAAMAASGACSSNAAAAVLAYAPAGSSAGEWFLPSKDELNAICNFARIPTAPPTGACTGSQNASFAAGDYGFGGGIYWTSSQFRADIAWAQKIFDGALYNPFKDNGVEVVRPIRAF